MAVCRNTSSGERVAQDLRDVAESDRAARSGCLLIAAELASDLADRSGQIVALRGDAVIEAVCSQRRKPAGIVGLLGHRLDEPVAIVPAGKGRHELDVLHVLAVILLELVDRHVDETRAGCRAEFIECREEFVVIARHRDGRHEGARRERIDQLIVELLIVHGVGRGHVARKVALRLRQQGVRRVRAEMLLGRPRDETFRIDGAGQMGVEVAALRHAAQERAQLGMVVSRRVEAGGGDDRVELARDHGQANDDDDGRQKNDGEKNAACHRWPPAALHCRAS